MTEHDSESDSDLITDDVQLPEIAQTPETVSRSFDWSELRQKRYLALLVAALVLIGLQIWILF